MNNGLEEAKKSVVIQKQEKELDNTPNTEAHDETCYGKIGDFLLDTQFFRRTAHT